MNISEETLDPSNGEAMEGSIENNGTLNALNKE
ncbi:hypothetical protein BH11BAC1_BH11BAC1_26740 [soil metagenome]